MTRHDVKKKLRDIAKSEKKRKAKLRHFYVEVVYIASEGMDIMAASKEEALQKFYEESCIDGSVTEEWVTEYET